MKKVIFGIFAHPDDETFGPSASFLKAVAAGDDLHLISITAGQAGMNDLSVEDLGETRLNEWLAAGQAMGARSQQALGFDDGYLCNHHYQAILEEVKAAIIATVNGYNEPIAISLVTFDLNGLTGHIDHILVSSVVTKLYYVLPSILPPEVHCQELAYYCLSQQQAPHPNTDYFVFMPAGREAAFLNRTVDVSEYVARKFELMRLHTSQRHDAENAIAKGAAFHATDCFHVLSRPAV